MLFNLHHGQMRLDAKGMPYYRPKSPKGTIMMSHIKDGSGGIYHADKLGNIEVVALEHIDCMVGLGYPIYNGDGKQCPVPMDDLLFITAQLDSMYWRKIEEGKHLRVKT